jgi:hypothetical protein
MYVKKFGLLLAACRILAENVFYRDSLVYPSTYLHTLLFHIEHNKISVTNPKQYFLTIQNYQIINIFVSRYGFLDHRQISLT